MRKFVVPLAVVAALLAAGAAFNPSAEAHRARIQQAVSERSQIEGLLGVGQLLSFVSKYHSLGIASYTTVNDKTTSVGAFGLVYVAD